MDSDATLSLSDDHTTPSTSQIFTEQAQMNTLLVRQVTPVLHGRTASESFVSTMLDERPQLDPGWTESNIAAIVEDFLRAQLDPSYQTNGQLDPGFRTMAQIDLGARINAQLDPGYRAKAQLDPTTKAQLDPSTKAQLDPGMKA
jgi:hypothetical protein